MRIAAVVLMKEPELKQRLLLPRLLGVLVSPKRKEAAVLAKPYQPSHSTSFLSSNASAPSCDVFVACLRASYTTSGLEVSGKTIQLNADTSPTTMPPRSEALAPTAGMEENTASRGIDGGTAE